jgi:transcriptional regulator with PAS, ATPase and Fis domain
MTDMVDVIDLPQFASQGLRIASTAQGSDSPGVTSAANQSLDEHEKRLVKDALDQAGGNQSKAARQLRIGRDALRYKMKKYGLL